MRSHLPPPTQAKKTMRLLLNFLHRKVITLCLFQKSEFQSPRHRLYQHLEVQCREPGSWRPLQIQAGVQVAVALHKVQRAGVRRVWELFAKRTKLWDYAKRYALPWEQRTTIIPQCLWFREGDRCFREAGCTWRKSIKRTSRYTLPRNRSRICCSYPQSHFGDNLSKSKCTNLETENCDTHRSPSQSFIFY